MNNLCRFTLFLLLTLFAGVLALCEAPREQPLWARVTLLDVPGTKGPFDATLTIVIVHRDPWYPYWTFDSPKLALNTPSEWMNLEKLPVGLDVATAMVTVSVAGEPVQTEVRVRVELARSSGGPVLGTLEVADPRGKVGFVIPERAVPDTELPARFQSIMQIAQQHLAAAQAVGVAPEDRPKHFVSQPFKIISPDAAGDPAIVETEMRAAAMLGYNSLGDIPAATAEALGVPFFGGADFRPPGIDSGLVTSEEMRAYYQERADALKANIGSLERLRFFAMADEPCWFFPEYPVGNEKKDKPETLARFHSYLDKQGLTPRQLGATSWAGVKFASMPAERPTLAQRRLWYETTRFTEVDQLRIYAAAAADIRATMGEQVLAYVNWNNPGVWVSDFSSFEGYPPYGVSHNWFNFSRAKGSTCLWLGPGNSEGGGSYRSTFRTWSCMLDLLRSAAKVGVDRFGAYVHHNMIADERAYEVALSIMAIAGRGGSGYDSYLFGPHYAFTEYMWSEKYNHYKYAADANRLIGRSEHMLVDAKPPQAEVAILWPSTSQLYDRNRKGYWTYNRDYLVEAQQVYFALTHSNIPVDFVDETLIQSGELGHYKALYLVEPNLQAKTVKALDRWVRGGGRLWASALAGIKDEYDLPTTAMDRLLGIKQRTVQRNEIDYSPKGGLRSSKSLGTVTFDDAAGLGTETLNAYGTRAAFKLADGAVIGRFDDGRAAAIRRRLGKGEVLYFATMLGLAYSRGATEQENIPTVDYPLPIAKLITSLPDALGIAKPVATSLPTVEALRLNSPRGCAITLLNWSTKPLARLDVVVRDVAMNATIRSARGETLTTTREGTTVTITMAMPEVTDVLLVELP